MQKGQIETNRVKFHQSITIHALGLVQGHKLDIFGASGIIHKGAFDGVVVMSTNGNQSTPTTNVVVKLFL